MSEWQLIVGAAIVAAVIAAERWRYKNSPHCRWCDSRHFGRCIFNPRSGRIFANVNDGHFDVNDPNK